MSKIIEIDARDPTIALMAALLRGWSGVSAELVALLTEMLSREIPPFTREALAAEPGE